MDIQPVGTTVIVTYFDKNWVTQAKQIYNIFQPLHVFKRFNGWNVNQIKREYLINLTFECRADLLQSTSRAANAHGI